MPSRKIKQVDGIGRKELSSAVEEFLRHCKLKNLAKATMAYYTEDLTYQHMGEVFHYHPNYISQVVREKTGLPLRRYLLRLRVRQASRLLLDKEISVEEVAAQVGFRDVSYFVQYFKKVTGMTPGELRGK